MASYLDASCTGTSGIQSAVYSDSYIAATSTVTVIAENTSLGIGDSCTVQLGYVGDRPVVFSGYVKSVERKEPERLYTIVASNVLIRAVDYFIASLNPEEPFTRDHIKAEKLVEEVLDLAGLTNYSGSSTSFTFGINTEVEVNLVSAYDFCKFIANTLAWHLYADNSGKVHFKDIKPHVTGSPVDTLNDTNLLSINYSQSDRELRNRVVVYGTTGIYAEAKAASPHLPAGFYKSVVVAAPAIIDSLSIAQQSANYNLAALNRLTKRVAVSMLGNANIACRDTVTVTRPSVGVTGNWFVYSIEHNWSKTGFVTNMELRS